MSKISEIFQAWGIMFNPDSSQANLANKRIEVCHSCENKKDDPFIHCGKCMCPLKAKIYSPIKGACPEGKWNEIDKNI